MNTYEKAVYEFDRMKKENYCNPEDVPVVLEFEKEILALVKKFGESGQSGGSAPFVSQIISQVVKKLCMHEPLSGITGEDDEWVEHKLSDGVYYQNKRNSAVFKDDNGKAYYHYAIIWQGEDQYDSFTGTVEGISSSQYIKKFPFESKRFTIDVIREPNTTHPDRTSCRDGDYLYKIKDFKQLEAVWEYYDKKENK